MEADSRWQSFRASVADERFILPLHEFQFSINYVTTLLDANGIAMLSNFVSSCVLRALSGRPGCPLYAVDYQLGSPADKQDRRVRDAEPAYFQLAFSVEPYDFLLQIGPTILRLSKKRTSLEDLVNSVPVYQAMLKHLFPVQSAATRDQPEDRPASFVDFIGDPERIHRLTFSFEHRLRAGRRLSAPQKEVTTQELLARMLHLGSGSTSPSPLADLNPEGWMRGDAHVSFLKTLGGSPRNVWAIVEVPYTFGRRDLDVKVEYRCGEGMAPYRSSDIHDWVTPIDVFYRDLIVNRFLPGLLHDIAVDPRL